VEEGFALTDALLEVGRSVTTSMAEFVPRILTAVAVVLVGLLVAKLVERLLRGFLVKVRFDAILERLGLADALARVGVKGSASHGVGRIVYFLLLVLFTQSAARSVGLVAISSAIQSFFSYVPNLVAAVAIVLLGTVVARAAARMVETSARDSGIDYAPTLGRVVSALIMFVMLIMAVTQLEIDTELIRSVAIVLIAGAALAFALTFGLGSRGITRNVLAGFYIRKLVRPGERVEVSGVRGTLVAVTPVKTVVETDDEVIAVANEAFLDGVVKL